MGRENNVHLAREGAQVRRLVHPPAAGGHDGISESEVRAQLDKILRSDLFARSGRSSRLLQFTVNQRLAGKVDALKESVLGIEVFDKDASFDPRTDTVVRVQARRLRAALTEYYAGDGKHDRLVIEIPTGGYVPSFHKRAEGSEPAPSRRKLLAVLSGGGLGAAGFLGWWWNRGRHVVAGRIDSIAVLPFVDLSMDKEQEYLCDGLADEIINMLGRVVRPRVVARTSAFQFRGKRIDIREVGRQLGVDAVLEGSVRKAGTRVRITCQLISVADGYELWAESYDREFKDILALQTEIAQAVTQRFGVRLSGKPSGPTNPEAYASYLQGRFYAYKWTVDGLLTSIRHYERAIAVDPDYALAFAGLADSYGVLGHLGIVPAKEAYAKKQQVLGRALQLDPNLPEARAALAMTEAYYEWNWAGAEREFRRTLEMHPQSVTVRRAYAIVLSCLGRFEEATEEIEKAHAIDPLSVQVRATAGVIAHRAKQYERAMGWYKQALDLDENANRALLGLGELYLDLGDHSRAIQHLEKASLLTTDDPETLGILAYGLARTGRRREALALAMKMKDIQKRRPVPAAFFADVYIGLGDNDRALELLEQACDEREGRLVQLKVNPRYDSLRSNPRFSILLKKLGLPSSSGA